MSSNRNPLKTQFAIRFVKALTRIQRATPVGQSRKKRSQRIKRAADASMSTTIGYRRSWSRAILLKHRNQVRNRVVKTRMNAEKKKVGRIDKFEGVKGSVNRANKLRKLVPGGDAMDFCSLLEETAHYIKCLNTQVQVMQKIADMYET